MAPDNSPEQLPRRGIRMIEEAYAFDDVLLVPSYSTVLPSQTDTRTRMTREITLNIPLITAGSLISILPIMIVYIILRRQILESFSSTGLKS